VQQSHSFPTYMSINLTSNYSHCTKVNPKMPPFLPHSSLSGMKYGIGKA
jgi:hypothetical protein